MKTPTPMTTTMTLTLNNDVTNDYNDDTTDTTDENIPGMCEVSSSSEESDTEDEDDDSTDDVTGGQVTVESPHSIMRVDGSPTSVIPLGAPPPPPPPLPLPLPPSAQDSTHSEVSESDEEENLRWRSMMARRRTKYMQQLIDRFVLMNMSGHWIEGRVTTAIPQTLNTPPRWLITLKTGATTTGDVAEICRWINCWENPTLYLCTPCKPIVSANPEPAKPVEPANMDDAEEAMEAPVASVECISGNVHT